MKYVYGSLNQTLLPRGQYGYVPKLGVYFSAQGCKARLVAESQKHLSQTNHSEKSCPISHRGRGASNIHSLVRNEVSPLIHESCDGLAKS